MTRRVVVSHTGFRPGDPVRNVNGESEHCGREGTFIRYWRTMPGGELYTTNNACDVIYPDAKGPYDCLYVAQSADDLERVEGGDALEA
jgi:hypothetical protein